MGTAPTVAEPLLLSPDQVLSLPAPMEKAFLTMVGVLSSTIVLKFASIQYLEYLYFLLIAYLFVRMARANFAFRTDPPLARLIFNWVIWCALALATAVYSLDRRFYYILPDLLHHPVWVSIARIGEVLANVAALFYLSHVFRRSPRKLLYTMRVYFYTGVVSAYYSFFTQFGLHILHHAFWNANDRGNGFYNEGGPYGLYLVSVLTLGIFLRPLERGRKWFYLHYLVCIGGLGLSVSKAGYAAILALFGLSAILAASVKQKIVSAFLFVILAVVLITQTPLKNGIVMYLRVANIYEMASNLHPDDLNLVAGRYAGLYLLPKMVVQHPWFGVGFAHYGLVRNDPTYRGLAVFYKNYDVPGLGMLQYLAELGFPVTLYLLVLLCTPFVMLRRITHLRRITVIALVQPVVHFLGGQINLTYPWVMSAFAIGLTSWILRDDTTILESAASAEPPFFPSPTILAYLPETSSVAE